MFAFVVNANATVHFSS